MLIDGQERLCDLPGAVNPFLFRFAVDDSTHKNRKEIAARILEAGKKIIQRSALLRDVDKATHQNRTRDQWMIRLKAIDYLLVQRIGVGKTTCATILDELRFL